MIRSMFTAISSLHLHQDFMDVVSDNLANANTYGYKASRFSFQDQYSQLISPGAAPGDGKGGINPVQIGLGTLIGSANPVFTQGPLQSTGLNTDLAIRGDGFFILSNGGSQLYSRDGMLNQDTDGYLVHGATGMRIQGWPLDAAGTANNGANVTDIKLPVGSSVAQATTSLEVGGNLQTGSAFDLTAGVYDSQGNSHNVLIHFTPTATANQWQVTLDGATGPFATLQFDPEGQFVSSAPVAPATTTSISIPGATGANPINVNLDFDQLTQLSTEGDVSVLAQDGLPAGDWTSFYVSADDGKIYGLYSNGKEIPIAQLAFARFANPAGLLRNGQNMYQEGLNSGEPSIGAANTGGRGAVVSGYLEGSNVNMAQEFTNMILAQRGFQASSRVITTSDELLQELVNLKR